MRLFLGHFGPISGYLGLLGPLGNSIFRGLLNLLRLFGPLGLFWGLLGLLRILSLFLDPLCLFWGLLNIVCGPVILEILAPPVAGGKNILPPGWSSSMTLQSRGAGRIILAYNYGVSRSI